MWTTDVPIHNCGTKTRLRARRANSASVRPLPLTPTARYGVFTRQEAADNQWTRSALRYAVRSGRLARLSPGVYAPAFDDSAEAVARRARFAVRSVAAVLATSGSVASHLSAACLAGLPTWSAPELPCITVSPGRTGDALSVHLHRASMDSADVIDGDGILRTTVARTVVDIAREHGWIEAVVVGDAALAGGMTTTAQLDTVLAACAHWPGICRARGVVAELDRLAESPLESVSRMRIRQLGLPPPRLQVPITDLRGVELGRVDFYWPDLGVIGEVDGRMKYVLDPETAIWEEKRRQERLEDTGLVVVRWGKPELDQPELLRRKLLAAFGRAAHRRRGGSGWGTSEVAGLRPDMWR